jgi:hypothetical protein
LGISPDCVQWRLTSADIPLSSACRTTRQAARADRADRGFQMVVVNLHELQPGLVLASRTDAMFRFLRVERVTEHSLVVVGRQTDGGKWSKPFRCRDRGRGHLNVRDHVATFFAVGFGDVVVVCASAADSAGGAA